MNVPICNDTNVCRTDDGRLNAILDRTKITYAAELAEEQSTVTVRLSRQCWSNTELLPLSYLPNNVLLEHKYINKYDFLYVNN